MNDKQATAEASIVDQTNLLPKRQLLIVFGVLAISLFICFVDQNGIGVILPTISRDLDAADTISWAGTSALIANTVFQVLFGRLSDLFGQYLLPLQRAYADRQLKEGRLCFFRHWYCLQSVICSVDSHKMLLCSMFSAPLLVLPTEVSQVYL
jgi:MFS family permease